VADTYTDAHSIHPTAISISINIRLGWCHSHSHPRSCSNSHSSTSSCTLTLTLTPTLTLTLNSHQPQSFLPSSSSSSSCSSVIPCTQSFQHSSCIWTFCTQAPSSSGSAKLTSESFICMSPIHSCLNDLTLDDDCCHCHSYHCFTQ